MLSVLGKLEALRNKALSDLDRLYDVRKEALADPMEFVNKLQQDPKVNILT